MQKATLRMPEDCLLQSDKPRRGLKLLLLSGTIAFAIGFPLPVFAGPAIIKDKSDGYAIPAYGEDVEIVGTYQADDGHLVFDFWYKDHGRLKEDFYDTATRERLFKNQESKIANDNAARNSAIKKAGITALTPDLYSVQITETGVKAHNAYSDGKTCHWPYERGIALGTSDASFMQESIFIPLAKPRTKTYVRDCEVASDTASLTTKYGNNGSDFLADDKGGFWAIVTQSPFAIHFDRDGHSDFFKGRSDIVLVPDTAALLKLHDQADKSRDDQQGFVNLQEDIIDRALADQAGSDQADAQ